MVSDNQRVRSSALVISRWLWPGNKTFLEVDSMVVNWWIVASLRCFYMHLCLPLFFFSKRYIATVFFPGQCLQRSNFLRPTMMDPSIIDRLLRVILTHRNLDFDGLDCSVYDLMWSMYTSTNFILHWNLSKQCAYSILIVRTVWKLHIYNSDLFWNHTW